MFCLVHSIAQQVHSTEHTWEHAWYIQQPRGHIYMPSRHVIPENACLELSRSEQVLSTLIYLLDTFSSRPGLKPKTLCSFNLRVISLFPAQLLAATSMELSSPLHFILCCTGICEGRRLETEIYFLSA